MVRLREIPRTATFAWSPGAHAPLIATGTRAGAVDADFSSETQLEIWDLALDTTGQTVELQPVASVGADSRFHDIAWSQASDAHPRGIIAGGLDSGALDLWDAAKLLGNESTPLISRAEKHSAAIKALQFNPFRPELLATAGGKGELYITDINNAATSFRLGTSAARADDFDAVDWNKKVPHILATGSSGGFVTVWDVKLKKENLTLNNLGRKPVSAVAWDPNVATDLITATPSNTDPLILVWDLRNSSAPKQTLKAHEQGVLSLSWCRQDADLLLSCGQDNRTICWNPHTGQTLGEFPVVTNWTFQTRFHPHNPHLLATASFDGKIAVQTLQNTRKDAEKGAAPQTQALDGEDFFAQARIEPQAATFSLPQAPKWLQRPVSVSFGFGGKLVKLSANEPGSAQKSKISISTFAVDSAIGNATEAFEKSLTDGDINGICETKIASARTEEEKADWTVMSTLISGNARKQLVEYLGFEDVAATEDPTTNGTAAPKDDAAFFEGDGEGDNFLSDLAATKGARTNNPFKVYTGDEKEADRKITQALIQGKFERALDICLKESRLSDAFMIAICGGQKCIDKAQAAYFKRKSDGPNYLRLLASVVGKNLWDVVHNANLDNWKEVMATLCTYADESEFPDLCEALGDRLEEAIAASDDSKSFRKDATFCYLAGSKLEKVVTNWVQELQEHENAGLEQSEEETSFSIHAKTLQEFIEKVTVFRQVTAFKDPDLNKEDDFKLAPLYSKYTEYADVVAAHGQLQVAEKYLDLLPAKYPAAEIARNRVKFATKKAAPAAQKQLPATAQRGQRVAPTYAATQPASIPAPQNPISSAYAPPTQATPSPYAPAAFQQPQQPPQPTASPYAPVGAQQPASAYGAAPGRSYTPAGYQQPGLGNAGFPQAGPYGGYQSAQSMPPPRNFSESPVPPPAANNKNIPDWNDIPDFGPRKAPPRRSTPGFANPYGTQPGVSSPPQTSTPGFSGPKPTPPPPPKGPPQGPPRVGSPAVQQGIVPPPRPSSAANTYAPPATPSSFAPHMQPPRTSSPYNPPPGAAASSNRYAPAPGSQPSPAPGGMPPPRQVAPPPNPYAASPYAAQPPPQSQAPPAHAPPAGPPRGPPQGPPRAGPPSGPPGRPPQGPPQGQPQAASSSRPSTAQSGGAATPAPKYPPGDRSHIPASASNVYQILHADMQRVKSKAPASYVQQVNDVEKRINILFDHLNNEQVVRPDTIAQLDAVAQAIQNRDHAGALGVINEIVKTKTEEGTVWMVGVQRLIKMSKATPF